jgi:hypothetical protein
MLGKESTFRQLDLVHHPVVAIGNGTYIQVIVTQFQISPHSKHFSDIDIICTQNVKDHSFNPSTNNHLKRRRDQEDNEFEPPQKRVHTI